jgi:hypothetical protein
MPARAGSDDAHRVDRVEDVDEIANDILCTGQPRDHELREPGGEGTRSGSEHVSPTGVTNSQESLPVLHPNAPEIWQDIHAPLREARETSAFGL